MDDVLDSALVERRLRERRAALNDDAPSLPSLDAIRAAEASLLAYADPAASPPKFASGLADADVVAHILNDIVPAIDCGAVASSRYYGFVTGSVLPVASWADNVVTHLDANAQLHRPQQSAATTLEQAALTILARLLHLDPQTFAARVCTTGATGSNILGLACGREFALARKLNEQGLIAELGLLEACQRAKVARWQVLTSACHCSVVKAASVLGLGTACVKQLALSEEEPWRLDLSAVERTLRADSAANIIVVSAGEVNTGRFALQDFDDWKRLRELATKYGAWVHVDATFGLYARLLDDSGEFSRLKTQLEGIELADSITVDGHKMLNVPYDCGMFYARCEKTLRSVFQNPNAFYLGSDAAGELISPLHLGLENSRRLRALPVYAACLSEGQVGFARIVRNMVRLARRVAGFLHDSPFYELLPDQKLEDVFMVVLFRARSEELNDVLVERINETRQMYVSGTIWNGRKAVRIAVSTWRVDVDRDFQVVSAILDAVAKGEEFDMERFRN